MINSVLQTLQALQNDRFGLTAFDYALIGSLTAVAIIAGLRTYGADMSAEWNYITAAM
jgi:Flp pilus assembly pilin Flp